MPAHPASGRSTLLAFFGRRSSFGEFLPWGLEKGSFWGLHRAVRRTPEVCWLAGELLTPTHLPQQLAINTRVKAAQHHVQLADRNSCVSSRSPPRRTERVFAGAFHDKQQSFEVFWVYNIGGQKRDEVSNVCFFPRTTLITVTHPVLCSQAIFPQI